MKYRINIVNILSFHPNFAQLQYDLVCQRYEDLPGNPSYAGLNLAVIFGRFVNVIEIYDLIFSVYGCCFWRSVMAEKWEYHVNNYGRTLSLYLYYEQIIHYIGTKSSILSSLHYLKITNINERFKLQQVIIRVILSILINR